MLASFLPRALLPLLLSCLAACAAVFALRARVSPPEDAEDRRRGLREAVYCFLAAVLACFAWHIAGPIAERWQDLATGTGAAAAAAAAANAAATAGISAADALFLHLPPGAQVPVDASPPDW
jgi:hypothetical protein